MYLESFRVKFQRELLIELLDVDVLRCVVATFRNAYKVFKNFICIGHASEKRFKI